MVRYALSTLLLTLSVGASTADKTFTIMSYYLGDRCSGTPYMVFATEDGGCKAEECSSSNGNDFNDMVSVDCSTEFLADTRSKFGRSPYIIQVGHEDQNCSHSSWANGYSASGTCEGAYNDSISYYVIASLNQNGSGSIETYPERSCFTASCYSTISVDKGTLTANSCDSNWYRWYSSNDKKPSSGSASTLEKDTPTSSYIATSAIVGIILAGVVVMLSVVAVFIFRYCRRSSHQQSQLKDDLLANSIASLEKEMQGQDGLWNDDVITSKRVPRDKVQVQELISRGSFGEVYHGVFNDKKVAIKMLLPAIRVKIKHVNDFLSEAKMTATMDHPHIVAFIGVAWDSLSDLCVVLEFMDGGELRTLLDNYLETDKSVGFNREKATIAFHVCHALAYLHSLSPSVIHRDLKSRNILLNSAMEAKLSDFGISRERLDRTMTAGVGTSLWMAPEVMLGERYDDKADMFSFGVVLSELDVHTLPYTRVKQQTLDSNGHEITDSVLLQKVALGAVSIEFSKSTLWPIVELGRACVSIDPTERPSSAEALCRLQKILTSRKLR